jgi:hypothetical protein
VSLETKQITVGEERCTMYGSTTALRQLLGSESTQACIVKISPKGYTLENGLDYCHVGLKSRDGTDYSIQAYGKEAVELHSEATKLRY